MAIACVFPGQGSQFVGMGRDLAEHSEIAAEVFRAVDAALKEALSSICWEGPEERLRLTAYTQPALLAHSIAAWRMLERRGLKPVAMAGHSLGEYSALVASGALPLEDAALLVHRRGQFMQEAVPVGEGAMAAVLGLDDAVVTAACEEASSAGSEVVPANFNAPGQVVIAGAAAAVERALALARERGARRAIPLNVSAPFHSPLMAPAREALEPHLRRATWSDPVVPVYRNVDAEPVRDAASSLDGVIRQVDAPVQWTDTVRRLVQDGVDTVVEVGAGNVLCGLARRIERGLRCYPAGTVEKIETVMKELGDG